MGILEGKRALITGGASGIGKASALLFAMEGAAVAVADRDAAKGQKTVRELEEKGAEALFIATDVTRAEDCEDAVRQTVARFSGLDVLLNSAGIIVRQSVDELDEADWDRVMDTNAKSVYLMSKFAIPAMRASGSGTIINVSSGWGLAGGAKAAAYCASKGAVVLLSKAMAVDCGPQGIRVNCLCPGDTDTPLLRGEARQLGASMASFLADAAKRPLGRVGTPEDIARAALFLATDAASYITGTTLVVDGGGLATQ